MYRMVTSGSHVVVIVMEASHGRLPPNAQGPSRSNGGCGAAILVSETPAALCDISTALVTLFKNALRCTQKTCALVHLQEMAFAKLQRSLVSKPVT